MNRINCIIKHTLFQSTLTEIELLEQDRVFCLHDLEHYLSVARIMYILTLERGLNLQKDIIYATALLHDIGRAAQYKSSTPHALESATLAQSILKDCSYTSNEIDAILQAILSHNKKEQLSVLASVLEEADTLSRNCYHCKAYNECYWAEERKNKGVIV